MIKKYLLGLMLLLAFIVPAITFAESNDADDDIDRSQSSQVTIAELQAKIKELTAQLARLQGNTSSGQCRLEISQDLFFGDEDFQSSHNIQTLQKLLQKHGYLKMPIGANYGFFGRITLTALTRFQAVSGINEVWKDNINYVGPQTRRALSGCGNVTYPVPTPVPVPNPGGLTVVSPNGGEVFKIGDKVGIRWISSNNDDSAFARISISGSNYYNVFSSTRDDGSESWIIPSSIQGGSYRLSVSLCRSDNDCYDNDFSDLTFKIHGSDYSGNLPPVIHGVNGPTSLKVGEKGTWTVKASDPENGTLNYSVLWGDEMSNNHLVPTLSNKREISQTATFTHTYSSAGYFSPTFYVSDNAGNTQSTSLSVLVGNVTPTPTIRVISPNGGETWAINSTKTISWKSENTASEAKVAIYLQPFFWSCDSRTSICPAYNQPVPQPIILDANVDINTPYNWIVGTDMNNNAIATGQYWVKVCLAGYSSVCDLSDQPFTISQPTVAMPFPALELRLPNGGETIVRGASQEISWAGGLTDVWKINLFIMDADPAKAVTNQRSLAFDSDNDAHETVLIPDDLEPGLYNFRVSCQNCSTFPTGWFDDSNAPFMIAS